MTTIMCRGTLCDRCSLRKTTLYFGWLLPMSFIILHNLIVFAMVIRVLASNNPAQAPLTSNIAAAL